MANPNVMSGNLRLKLDDKTIFHAINSTYDLSREIKERETKDTTGIEVAKGKKSATVGYNGLATYAGDGTSNHDFFQLFDLYDDDTTTLVQVEFTPEEADAEYYLAGEGIIDKLTLSGGVGEDATIDLSVRISGVLTKTAIT